MNNRLSALERAHLKRVKALPCAVCGAAAPSQAHHIRQHRQFLCVALCADCHTGSHNGWHAQRSMWRVRKIDELDALDATLRMLCDQRAGR